MTRRAVVVAAIGFAALGVAIACGDVPTLPFGVAYITPIQLPSPSVAVGDTMRDSLGVARPLRVFALGRDSTDTISNVTLRFILTSLRTGARITDEGYLIAPDSLVTLRLVAQVTDGTPTSDLKLQTPELSVDVVPLADSIAATSTAGDSLQALPLVRALSATVTGIGPGATRGPVGGIRVRYRVSQVFPSSVGAEGRYYLTNDANAVIRSDSTTAIDTTTASGVASRSFVGIRSATGGADADSVVVTATALSQRGVPLRGSPARFVIRIRKS